MKKLFEMYMELPMSVVVGVAVVTWVILAGMLLTPAIIFYFTAWCMILGPFLGAVTYTEYKHKEKVLHKQYLDYCRVQKNRVSYLGED